MDTQNMGITFNRWHGQGRVVGNPDVGGGWATFNLLTLVPEIGADGKWGDVECLVPCLTNNEKTINTIQQYVANERQLFIEGYVKTWQNNGFGIIITNIKLGAKSIYNPGNAQQQNQQQQQRYPS